MGVLGAASPRANRAARPTCDRLALLTALSCKWVRLKLQRHKCVAARKGLEPLTFALGKRCSILLSYRAALRAWGP
jgi:hypothetical protein